MLKRGETQASFTFPAHFAFFVGILPILDSKQGGYLKGIDQIWRSSSAKKRNKSVLVEFDNKTIIDYYFANKYTVLGVGGVSFFSSSKNNILPKIFPKFIYFEKPKGISSQDNVPRDLSQFPLANNDKIISQLDVNKPYFLFVNCPETHIPYDSPAVKVNDKYKETIRHMYSVDFIKNRRLSEVEGLNETEVRLLINAQKKSLEWIDGKISELVGKLPKNSLPTLLLVMADHGEEFGDNGRYGHAHLDNSVMTVPVWCTIMPNK